MNKQTFFFGPVIALILAAAAPASAGSFSVSPTRVELAAGQRAAVITLRNADSRPLTVQTQLVSWSQSTGEDEYTETRDVLATPPVFTIPAGGEQVVRVALRIPADANREMAYRVFFQEIPGQSASGTNSLNFALRVGLPIFITPAQKVEGKLEWSLQRLDDGKLRVEALNSGNAHVQVTGFELSLAGTAERVPVEGMKYVLPGNRVSWIVEPPAGLAANPASAWVIGSSDSGAFEAQAGLAPRL